MFKYLVLFALIAVAVAKPLINSFGLNYAAPLTYASTYDSLPLTYAANAYAAAPYAAPYAAAPYAAPYAYNSGALYNAAYY